MGRVSVVGQPPQPFARTPRLAHSGHDVRRAREPSHDCQFSVRVQGPDDFIFDGISRPLQIASGLSEAGFVGRRVEEVFDGAHAEAISRRYRECVRRGAPITYLETLDLPIGRTRWKTQLTPVRDLDGQIVGLSGAAEPVAVPDPAHRALRIARRDYQRAIDLSPSEIAVLDAAGRVVQVNAAWRKFGEHHGATKQPIGLDYVEICETAAAGGAPEAALIAQDLRKMLASRVETFLSLPYECAGAHFIVRGSTIDLAGMRHVVLAHQDITRVFETQRELSQTTERLITVQEEERARIGVELHDSTSQHLAAISLSLARLRQGAGPVGEIIDDISAALAEAQKEIRSLTYLLHPPELSREGLELTLRSFITGFQRRSGLRIALETQGPLGELSFEIQRAVFRVIQEALANVHRHAEATCVSITLHLQSRGLHLMVSDDGRPRQPTAAQANGVGIPGMSARMRQFGGRLKVRWRHDGVRVSGFIPRVGLSGYGRASLGRLTDA